MTVPSDDLGLEFLDNVLAQRERPQQAPEDRGIVRQAAEGIAFGAAGSPDLRRQAARTGARVAESVAGLPGDVRELFNSIAIGIPEYFAGEELPRWRRAVQGDPEMLGGIASGPTSVEIREGVTDPAGGEFLQPQSKYEEFGDEIAQDFAVLALPVKGKIPFARALGTSVLANAGGEVGQAFGGDKAEAATKMGLLFASGMFGHGQGSVKQHIRGLYNEMEAAVPQGAEVSASKLSSKLSNIEKALRKGDPADLSKQPAIQKIKAIREKISGDNISVEELVELNKSTNEAIFGLGELKRGQHQLYNIRDSIHETLGEYGANNPDFLSKWKTANEAYAATEASRKVSNWVKRNVKTRDYLHALGALGIGTGAVGAKAALGTVGAAGALGATAYSAEVMKRIAQSQALRKYYQNVVTNSLKQNKAGFTRAMNQLDSGLEKSFEKDPFETIEFD